MPSAAEAADCIARRFFYLQIAAAKKPRIASP
jgi:hypothetical protein